MSTLFRWPALELFVRCKLSPATSRYFHSFEMIKLWLFKFSCFSWISIRLCPYFGWCDSFHFEGLCEGTKDFEFSKEKVGNATHYKVYVFFSTCSVDSYQVSFEYVHMRRSNYSMLTPSRSFDRNSSLFWMHPTIYDSLLRFIAPSLMQLL